MEQRLHQPPRTWLPIIKGRALIDFLGKDISIAFEEVFINGVPSSEYRGAAYWFRWLKLLGLSALLIGILIIFLLSR